MHFIAIKEKIEDNGEFIAEPIPYRQKGIGIEIYKQLVELALNTDPSIKITAQTLPENNFSTKILHKIDLNLRLLLTILKMEKFEYWSIGVYKESIVYLIQNNNTDNNH